MPTIIIDLPDNLDVPSNWDARVFVAAKMYEAGILSSDQAAQTIGVSQPAFLESARDYLPEPEFHEPANPTPELWLTSWFTPEHIAQFKENRRRLEEEYAKNPPPMTKEEFMQFILNGPIADEETIQSQDEIRKDMKQWALRS